MAHPSKSTKCTNANFHIVSCEPRIKGFIQNANRRPRSTALPLRPRPSSYIAVPKTSVRTKSISSEQVQPCYIAACNSQSNHGSSRSSTPGENKITTKDYFHRKGDGDDGSVKIQSASPIGPEGVTIQVNRPSILRLCGRSASSEWEVVEISDAIFTGKRPTHAASAGDSRKDDKKELPEKGTEQNYVPETELSGHTTSLRLGGYLRHLKKLLRLYKDYDELSRPIYNPDMHDDFLGIITDCFYDIYPALQSLITWNEQARGGPACRIGALLETSSTLVDIWDKLWRWIETGSNRRIEESIEEEGAVRTSIWQQRRDVSIATTRRMLKLLDVDFEDGMEEVDKNEAVLKREWKEDTKMNGLERNKKQWAVVADPKY